MQKTFHFIAYVINGAGQVSAAVGRPRCCWNLECLLTVAAAGQLIELDGTKAGPVVIAEGIAPADLCARPSTASVRLATARSAPAPAPAPECLVLRFAAGACSPALGSCRWNDLATAPPSAAAAQCRSRTCRAGLTAARRVQGGGDRQGVHAEAGRRRNRPGRRQRDGPRPQGGLTAEPGRRGAARGPVWQQTVLCASNLARVTQCDPHLKTTRSQLPQHGVVLELSRSWQLEGKVLGRF